MRVARSVEPRSATGQVTEAARLRADFERRKTKLEGMLRKFASEDLTFKQTYLKTVVRRALLYADPEVVEALADWSKPGESLGFFLKTAVEKALSTPLVTPTRTFTDWIDDYTVVVLDSNGNIRAFAASEGSDSSKFAVAKALCSMALDHPLNVEPGVLTNTRNLMQLLDLGMELGKDLFLGVAPCLIDDERLYVAAAGCHWSSRNEDYGRGLIGNGTLTRDTMAGALETMFAKVVAGYLGDVRTPVSAYLEPELISLVRALN